MVAIDGIGTNNNHVGSTGDIPSPATTFKAAMRRRSWSRRWKGGGRGSKEVNGKENHEMIHFQDTVGVEMAKVLIPQNPKFDRG